ILTPYHLQRRDIGDAFDRLAGDAREIRADARGGKWNRRRCGPGGGGLRFGSRNRLSAGIGGRSHPAGDDQAGDESCEDQEECEKSLPDHVTSMRRAPRPAALGSVTVSSPSFKSAETLSTSMGSGSTNARWNRPCPRSTR